MIIIIVWDLLIIAVFRYLVGWFYSTAECVEDV